MSKILCNEFEKEKEYLFGEEFGITKEMERQRIEDNLYGTIEFLDDLSLLHKPHKYKVLEYFPQGKPEPYKPRIYEVENLTLECEDGMVFGGIKSGNCIPEEVGNCVLSGFLEENILDIGHQSCFNYITISFDDGFIRIHY
ncbi:hypothetical protein [Anaerosporobacter sp.]